MAKDPVLPLYYNDLTTSTQDWTDEEFGAYVRLLIHQWRQGGLPKDYQRLTRIATSLDTNWPLLKTKFVEIDGLLKNMVMEDIRDKRAKHKQKQKDNVSKRYQNATKQPTKSVPLEEEHEKEIENFKIIKEQIPKLELFESIFSDQIYISDLSRTHPGKDLKQAFEECYMHHSVSPNILQAWEWRQKLGTWLTIKGEKNGTSKDRRQANTDSLKEALANDIRTEFGGR